MKLGCVLVAALMLVVSCAGPPRSTPAKISSPTRPVVDAPATRMSRAPAETAPPASTFFPLGFMMVWPEDLGQVAAGGFNIVHPFVGQWTIAKTEDYLDRAKAMGLGVITDLLPCKAQAGGYWDEQVCATYISALSAHDNLVAWFLPDETKDYDVAADLYEWVKKYDPQKRPVYANPGSLDSTVINRFPAFSDFIWGAWYPEYYGEGRALVTYGTRLDAAACQGTGTRWGAILQFFDSSEWGRNNGHPTASELRNDSYQAIVAGAKGLWYYHYQSDVGGDRQTLLEETQKIANEIVGTGGLDKVILSPESPQTITKILLSGPTQSPAVNGKAYASIQTLQKEYGGTYLFAVNIATKAVTVEFGNLPAKAGRVEVLFENRNLPIVDGRIQDTFQENDVHIYRITAARVYLPSRDIPT